MVAPIGGPRATTHAAKAAPAETPKAKKNSGVDQSGSSFESGDVKKSADDIIKNEWKMELLNPVNDSTGSGTISDSRMQEFIDDASKQLKDFANKTPPPSPQQLEEKKEELGYEMRAKKMQAENEASFFGKLMSKLMAPRRQES